MGRLQVSIPDVANASLLRCVTCRLRSYPTVCACPLCWQVTKNDLEQRHHQLDDIFTLAQNIKNKTSNLDVRTSISEKCVYILFSIFGQTWQV